MDEDAFLASPEFEALEDKGREKVWLQLTHISCLRRTRMIETFLRIWIMMAVEFLGQARARELICQLLADAGIPVAARRQ